MFAKKREYHKRGKFLPFVILRLLLSLSILAVFSIGIYQAFKYFSGVDPIKVDPKSAIGAFLASEGAGQLLDKVLGTKVSNLGNLRDLSNLKEDSKILPSSTTNNSPLILKFALVADPHNSNENLSRALEMAKEEKAKFVIGLGDYTEVGTISELQAAKDVFKASGLPYYITAGDHDFWDARDKGKASDANFNEIFGAAYQSFTDSGIRFIILSNADNYQGIDKIQMNWLNEILSLAVSENPKATFVFLHEVLYHPSSDRFMGKVKPELLRQAQELTNVLKENGVTEVFAGDIHSFTKYSEPKTGLKMTTVGALTAERNTQKPRFALVDVHENGGYNIEDLEIN